ncbi:MAG: VWA domain-containing protein [Planctomycetota bacterium]|nr:VWA domain-containing protein [Planctomycetota bacterium]
MIALLGFEILRPMDLSWLAVALVVLLLGRVAFTRTQAEVLLMVDPQRAHVFFGGRSVLTGRIRLYCAALALLFGSLALSGPVRGFTLREVQRQGVDLVFCLDASKSMLVEDMGLSRLDEAKRQIKSVFPSLVGDRVALISFSGEARRIAPLTRDLRTLGWFLDGVDPGDHALGGTDLAAALTDALDFFDGRTGAHEAIVLITDGEDHGARGLEIAAEAARLGIAVHVLGVGTRAGGKIPLPNGGWVRGPDGKEVVSRLAPETLEDLAHITGGTYVGVEGAVLGLERLYREGISTLDGQVYDQGMERIPHDRFQWPLVLGILCMGASMLLNERRPAKTEVNG